MNGWAVELSPAARQQYRQLGDGPKSAARDLLEDLELEDLESQGPALIHAIELRENPGTWRVRFHHDAYRMIDQVSRNQRRIPVTGIRPRAGAYDGLKG